MIKRWFLTLLLPFLFVILTGLSNPQKEYVEKKTNSDSLTVNLKFQNPNLILKDQRNYDILNELLNKDLESTNEIADAINNLSGVLPYIVESQERRYESAMDYLERRTEYSPSQIRNFIKQEQTIKLIRSVVLLTYIILAFLPLLYVRNMDWRVYIVKLLSRLVFGIVLYFILYEIIGLFYSGLYEFHALLNLSG